MSEIVLDDGHNTELYLYTAVVDKNGVVVNKNTQPGKSFLYNWLTLFGACSSGFTTSGISLSGTNLVEHSAGQTPFMGFMIANQHSGGIIIGAGSGAVTTVDSYMGTIIQNGTSSGQMSYNEGGVTPTQINGSTIRKFAIFRSFENNSGADLVVRETGLITGGHDASDNGLLVIRDLIAPTITVSGGYTLVVAYILQTTA